MKNSVQLGHGHTVPVALIEFVARAVYAHRHPGRDVENDFLMSDRGKLLGDLRNVDLARGIAKFAVRAALDFGIVSEEREACAKIAVAQSCPRMDMDDHTSCGDIIAEQIRARNK